MAEASDSVVPTRDQLETLAAHLDREYEPRFTAANMDLAIGRAGSFISRGISVEISEDWYWFKAARWSLFRRHWVLVKGLAELEATARHFLETKLSARPSP
jgi:hypothetical protein